MERRAFLGTVVAGGAGLAALTPVGYMGRTVDDREGSSKVRTRQQIDFDWRFHLGDVEGGAEASSFNDNDWRILDLPHDWSIEGKIEKSNPSSWHGGYYPGGIGWYRKKLKWDNSWKNRQVFIDFDGVYMNSDVWINGHHLGHWPYGYTTFRYDLTPYLKSGSNVIAVRVDHSLEPSGRWYTGSGIYRHVWLEVVNPVHVDHWGTFVTTPNITKNFAGVKIETTLVNTGKKPVHVMVKQTIRDKCGQVVAYVENPADIEDKVELSQEMTITSPKLWSPDAPNLYKVETEVWGDNKLLDQYFTPLGIRKIEVKPNILGFRLNGVRTMIKGVCNHHDAGGALGTAVPDDVLYHRLKLLKEIGCNTIRAAHHPLSPELTTFCNELGLMVINEPFDGWFQPKGTSKHDYGNYFKEWWEKDLGNLLRRERNNPSVVMWSIGNEVGGFTNEWQIKIASFVRAIDNTRPITQARGSSGTALDVYGFNSEGEKLRALEDYHKEYPDRTLFGTEMPHSRQTRGVYFTMSRRPDAGPNNTRHAVPHLSESEVFADENKGYASSYDNNYFSVGVRDNFRLQNKKLPYMIGSCRWTGYDYLGEANDQWPFRSKDKGIFDLAGLAKDHYFLYQSLWTDVPMVHILPHWTHPGKEGVKIPVVAYTNCKFVELFFNDKSLGEKPLGEDLQIVWQVPYQPGTLRAVARNEDGFILAETTRKTAGAPSGVDVIANKTMLRPNRQDTSILEVTIVDSNGVMVPDADNLVTFHVEGPGKLIGVENGDVLDLEPTKFVDKRKVFKGKCIGIIQATDKTGEIKVTVSSDNLKSGTVLITSRV